MGKLLVRVSVFRRIHLLLTLNLGSTENFTFSHNETHVCVVLIIKRLRDAFTEVEIIKSETCHAKAFATMCNLNDD